MANSLKTLVLANQDRNLSLSQELHDAIYALPNEQIVGKVNGKRAVIKAQNGFLQIAFLDDPKGMRDTMYWYQLPNDNGNYAYSVTE
jgi:hypothetical protein